ncbi:hypothetical protein, partial [Chryseobacterium sp. SIMBA_029]|uniref:hypothetical protein n=3 Tax=Bacteria TaxID=2 RepID=UPI00397C406D
YLAYLQQETNIINPEIQYWSSMGNGPIDTNQNLQYTFTMPGDPAVKKKFKFVLDIPEYSYPIPPELPEVPGFPPLPKPRKDNLKIVLKRGSEIIIPQLTITEGMYKEYNLNGYPGTYSLEFVSTGGAVGTGSFNAAEMKLHPGPFRSAMATGYTRIKNIKYYKNTDDTSAYRTIDYEYDSFDLPNSASGYLYDTDRDSESDLMTQYVLYKNVKVSEAGTGMQRYYFKTPDDYPKQQIGGTAQEPQYFWPYYNVTKGGLLSKKEIYNEQNTLLTAELYDYELDKYTDEEYNFNTMGKITSKPSYVKKSNVISKAYFGGNQPVISQTETSMSPLNFQPNYIKETGSSGEIMEKQIYYPKDQSGYAHLENANITNIPVQTITKNNGKVISNTQLKYDNNKLQPTSAVLINPNDGSLKTAIRYDDYDAQGNLRQYTA